MCLLIKELNFIFIMPAVQHRKITTCGSLFCGRIDLWIVEALRATPHQSHSHYEQTFAWIERVKPKEAVLTHLGLEADYTHLMAICPANTRPGIDGLVWDL